MDGSSRSTQSGGPRTQLGIACNICLRRMPSSPILTFCGHLFCWPCLYRSWPQQGPGAQAGPAIPKPCPVCGTALREGFSMVPVYGFDNVASPRPGAERPTTTGTTTTAAAAAPVSNTPIPARPAAAAPNTAIPLSAVAAAAGVSPGTDIPPRPNPPARITQTHTQTQTDAARAAPAPLQGPNRLGSPRTLVATIPRHGTLGEAFGFGAGDRLRPSSFAARSIGLGVASRSIRRRSNLRLNPGGMDGNGGNRFESPLARMDRAVDEILDDIGASLAEINALFDARDEYEDDLI